MSESFAPSSPATIALANRIGEAGIAERTAAYLADNIDRLRQPVSNEEACYLCTQLVSALRRARTAEAQSEAWLVFRETAFDLFAALGPVPAYAETEIIPDGLAGYRPAELLRVFHRVEAETRRLERPDADFESLLAETKDMSPEQLNVDAFARSTEIELAIEDVNSTPVARADRADMLKTQQSSIMRAVASIDRASSPPSPSAAHDESSGGRRTWFRYRKSGDPNAPRRNR